MVILTWFALLLVSNWGLHELRKLRRVYSIDGLKFCLGFVSSCLSSDFQLDGVCEHHMYTVFNCLACHEKKINWHCHEIVCFNWPINWLADQQLSKSCFNCCSCLGKQLVFPDPRATTWTIQRQESVVAQKRPALPHFTDSWSVWRAHGFYEWDLSERNETQVTGSWQCQLAAASYTLCEYVACSLLAVQRNMQPAMQQHTT